jgi:hypothetical protein
MSSPKCPDCGSDRTYRIDRKGFLAKHVYPWFGFFPWECTFCWRVFRARNRGPKVARSKRSPV